MNSQNVTGHSSLLPGKWLRLACVLTLAAVCLAAHGQSLRAIQLKNGSTLVGAIVQSRPAEVTIKTDAGNVVLPVSELGWEERLVLPRAVSWPYLEIQRLQDLIDGELASISNQVATQNATMSNVVALATAYLPAAAAPVDQNGLQILTLDARVVEQRAQTVTISWKAVVHNHSYSDRIRTVIFQFLDANDFEVEQGRRYNMSFAARGATTVSEQCVMSRTVWEQVVRYTVRLTP